MADNTMMLVLVGLVITAVLVIAAFTPLNKNIEDVARSAAGSYATEIAGAINMLQSSPDGAEYTFVNMPDKNCIITTGRRVTVILGPGKSEEFSSVGTIGATPVERKTFECGIKGIIFSKGGGKITVEGLK